MTNLTRKPWRWLAPVALVGAVGLAACGDDDVVSTRTADLSAAERSEAAAGSDQHLRNQAAEIAERSEAVAGSDQHLRNQAAEIAERSEAVAGSDQHLRNQAAEIAERSEAVAGSDQHLRNQAAEIAERSGTESGPNVWTAGDRAAAARLTAQAEQYADQQSDGQDRQDQQEFVPGTRRMPMS
jgi:precorrin-6B methylase 1